MAKIKDVKDFKNLKDREIVEILQAQCKHSRRQVFSEEGHNFIQCQDCGKIFYEEDI